MGEVSPLELEEAFEKVVESMVENKFIRCIADCTKLTGGHSIVDLYSLIGRMDHAGIPRNLKEAVIINSNKEIQALGSFYGNASFNRGFNIRIFTDRTAALEWLDT
ncbi:MAG: hypothetical protein JW904_00670 [Spirochaetales bacterium]|nr:hypothetical protein [Spirochaetales bacterium]